MQTSLANLGWSDWQQQALQAHHDTLAQGRVVCQMGTTYWVDDGEKRMPAIVAGRLKHEAVKAEQLPVVGDWVLFEGEGAESRPPVRITVILDRKSLLSRRRPGNKGDAQVMAANVDLGLLVWGLDRAPNLRLLQRACVLAYAANIDPVVVLTKADVRNDAERLACEASSHLTVRVLAASVRLEGGLEALSQTIARGATAVLIGPSGAGKSSILNALMETSKMRVGDVSSDTRKGQHTTTHRELFRLPSGGLLIDGPGVREFGLLADAAAVERAFPDVTKLIAQCRSSACGHAGERDCAIAKAIEYGTLPLERLRDYIELLAEADGRPSPRTRRSSDVKRATRRS